MIMVLPRVNTSYNFIMLTMTSFLNLANSTQLTLAVCALKCAQLNVTDVFHSKT